MKAFQLIAYFLKIQKYRLGNKIKVYEENPHCTVHILCK